MGVDTMAVKKGDKIRVDYTGTLEDGSVFDSSEKHGRPLEFEVGAGQLIKGFDEAVIGMKKGEEKEIKLQPAEAYGERNDKLVQEVPRNKLPKDQVPKEGMMLALSTPNGKHLPAMITSVTDEAVKIDLNHPLAGKVLKFMIKVVETNPA